MVQAKMKDMPLFEHIFAYVTLGLLCGWYYFLMLLYPTLLYCTIRGSYIAGAILLLFIILSVIPLRHEPWPAFMNSWIFRIWCAYFDVTVKSEVKFDKGQKYMLYEFPHGIFPMGQFLSVYYVEKLFPGHSICGTGADIIFKVPIMRHIMAWLGTMPANRKNISKIFSKGYQCAIIPGGIAEMYLMNDKTEEVFLRTRRNTVKTAIQEGAHIVPVFFFGNSKIFHVLGGSSSNSWLSKLSRRLRASIVLFYGRHFLPVPLRHPIQIVVGEAVHVKQSNDPTAEEIDDVMSRVVSSLEKLYSTHKPEWENRPLVIK